VLAQPVKFLLPLEEMVQILHLVQSLLKVVVVQVNTILLMVLPVVLVVVDIVVVVVVDMVIIHQHLLPYYLLFHFHRHMV
jgi:hypothetical protein